MRNFKIFLFTVSLLLNISFVASSTTQPNDIRMKLNFNKDWKFSLTDSVKYIKTTYKDAQWNKVNLPHDWSTEGVISEKNSGRNAWLPGGTAWYRKTFTLPKEYVGKHIEIQFDGIYKDSKIWVNGYPVGVQHDGYTSFYYDITELVKPGETNYVAVRVDNSIQPNCRWYSGSGIYRNVWLTVVDPTHIATWGTYITTPEVNKSEATVSIRTEIENLDKARALTLETKIFDSKGIEIASTTSNCNLGNYQTNEFEQAIKVPNPQLWSPQTPIMYVAKSKLIANGKVIDTYQSRFGIRTLKFDAEKGFFINGVNMKMKGVCIHNDAGIFGSAVPDEVWYRRLKTLRDMGCNAIRTSHNPPSPEFMDYCDELGFLVMTEFVDKWNNATSGTEFYNWPMADPFFSEEWKKNFGETIRRDRNHPSVVIWSVGNENNSPGSDEENLGMKTYGAFVRSQDPTRPVISGMERGKDMPVAQKVNDIIETCEFMDLIALNYGEQWCKLIADKKPGKPFVSTESYMYFNSELEKRFASIERSPWLDVLENESNMGLFLWVGIDYLGEAKKMPKIGSDCGLLDLAGFRKCNSYLYEAFWSEKPVLHLEVYEGDADDFSTSGRWGWPPMIESWNQPKGKALDVVTYTNCETVDLYLNNKLIGTQKLADIPNWIMKWRKINYLPGTLRAVGKIGGKVVCQTELKTSGKPASVLFHTDSKVVSPNAVVQIELTLVDKKGIPVPNDDRQLQFKLEGGGEIIGLATGDISCHDSFKQFETKKTYNGKMLCIIRVGENTGKMKLNITANDLKTSNIDLEIK